MTLDVALHSKNSSEWMNTAGGETQKCPNNTDDRCRCQCINKINENKIFNLHATIQIQRFQILPCTWMPVVGPSRFCIHMCFCSLKAQSRGQPLFQMGFKHSVYMRCANTIIMHSALCRERGWLPMKQITHDTHKPPPNINWITNSTSTIRIWTARRCITSSVTVTVHVSLKQFVQEHIEQILISCIIIHHLSSDHVVVFICLCAAPSHSLLYCTVQSYYHIMYHYLLSVTHAQRWCNVPWQCLSKIMVYDVWLEWLNQAAQHYHHNTAPALVEVDPKCPTDLRQHCQLHSDHVQLTTWIGWKKNKKRSLRIDFNTSTWLKIATL